MRIGGVIFDFGGVLCFHPAEEWIAEAAAAVEMPVPEFLDAFWKERRVYDAGLLTAEQYWQGIAAVAGRRFPDALIPAMIEREIQFWSRYDSRVLAWIRQLRAAGIRTAILSNLPRPLGERLRITEGFLDHFDHVTFSYELRAAKPQVEIYEHAIRGLKVPPAQALFLDDRPENIEGARAAGLQAELFLSWEKFLESILARYGLPEPPRHS